MKRKIYAISLLLSFLVVFGHMMVPHHHHESFVIEFSSELGHHGNHSHPHNGKHRHAHGEEEHDNQTDDHSDHGFPQHFHISATDDFDLARINHAGTIDYKQDIQYFINSELFLRKFFEPPNISENYPHFELTSHTQHEPGANSLRGPPSIA